MIRKHLVRDDRGVSTVEVALTLPILVTFFYGIFQLGAIMAADAGMQHGLGEGARMATLFPTPANDDIKAKITATTFSVKVGTFSDPTIVDTNDATGRYRTMSITYTVTPNFLFFNGPVITMTRSKRVYITN
jgi:Flp pilus assembly protein TadG